MQRLKSFLGFLALSKIALLGAALNTSSIIADLILVAGELFLFESSPYIGIVVYVLFPALAILGLLLIPLGILWKLRRLGGTAATASALGKVNRLYVIQIVFGLSMFNLVVFGIVGYRSFHYVESNAFCGQLCHTVMEPEHRTHLVSPHSGIGCVACHVGSGAESFVKSKLSGVRQLFGVAFDSYARPIPTPLHNLRPANEICEACHSPSKQHGNVIRVREGFAEDELNTRTYTVLNMRLGGGEIAGREAHGIHWHAGKRHTVRYLATDEKREQIVWVELTRADGSRQVWTRPGHDVPAANDPRVRVMDCLDCHNRPAHRFLSPDEALDDWMARGELDRSIPWIRALAEEVLTTDYATREEADGGIATLPELYRERYPGHWESQRPKLEGATSALQEIHRLYVYPRMKIRWNTYPSRIGHSTQHTAGCFRCHNGILRDPEEKPISMDCETCHHVLANREKDPIVLRVLEKH